MLSGSLVMKTVKCRIQIFISFANDFLIQVNIKRENKMKINIIMCSGYNPALPKTYNKMKSVCVV